MTEESSVEVARGRWRDRTDVVVKTARSRSGAVAIRREYDLLRDIERASPAVRAVRALTFEETPSGAVLVLANVGSRSLRSLLRGRPLPLERFWGLALELSRLVSALHELHIIHGGIYPGNLIVDADDRITLAGFDVATRVIGRVDARHVSACSLPYFAPEQSGKMNRSMDQRADLYAVGATLYELLTGAPPFQIVDPGELIHAQLARTPVAPHTSDPAIPEPVSEIVLRLLRKAPEERYQTVEALIADLEEAQRRWSASGTIEPFELGRGDFDSGLPIPDRVYGRHDELAQLDQLGRLAADGGHALVTVGGVSGSGKTALLNAFANTLPPASRYVSGSASPLGHAVPFGPWVAAVRPLLREIIEGPAEQRARWREHLTRSLGHTASALVDVFPELQSLCGTTVSAEPASGGLEREGRLHFAWVRFATALAARFTPLVLFLDDMQWADPESLKLLRVLAAAPGCPHLVLAVAYRTDDVGATHPLRQLLDELSGDGLARCGFDLGGVSEAALTELLADALKMSHDDVATLAETTRRKTAGNPLFVRRFLHALHRDGLLAYDGERWRWNVVAVERSLATDNVVALMLDALRALSPSEQRLLGIVACARKGIDLEVLATVTGERAETIAADLWTPLGEGLLVAAEVTDGVPVYMFAHDRVHEAASVLVTRDAQRELHYRIGRALRDRQRGEWLFDAIHHLDVASDALSASERADLAKLSIAAARQACAMTAYDAALRHYERALALSGTLAVAVYRDAAESAYLAGAHARGDELIAAARSRANDALERADLSNLYATGAALRSDFAQAIRGGTEALAELGSELGARPGELWPQAIAELRCKLSTAALAQLAQGPRMEDRVELAQLAIMSNMMSSAYVLDPALFAVLAARMVKLSLVHGTSVHSAFACAALAMVLVHSGEDHALARDLSRAAIALTSKFDDPVQECRTFHVIGCFVSHWSEPLRSSVSLLRRAIARGLDGGELQFASYAAADAVLARYYLGESLAEIAAEIEEHIVTARRVGTRAGEQYLIAYRQLIRCLQGHTAAPHRLEDPVFSESAHLAACGGNPLALALYHVAAFEACVIARRFDEAERQLALANPYLQIVRGIVPVARWRFLAALTAVAGRRRDEAHEHLDALRGFAEGAPMNFAHQVHLIEAEVARLEGRILDAAEHYDRAIAEGDDYANDVAIACELCARCWYDCGRKRIGDQYLRAALARYRSWGASGKANSLEEEFPDAVEQAPSMAWTDSSDRESRTAALDLLALHKACSSISSEIVLDRLVERLVDVSVEVAGATGGVLLLERGGELTSLAGCPRDRLPAVPSLLVEECHRSEHTVVLGNAEHDPRFAGDPVLRDCHVKSAIALPIGKHRRARGVLYLENQLVAHAFHPERVRVLSMLCSQIEISLENSTLFEELRIEVGERRRAEEALRFLSEASVALAGSLDEQETLARIARLAVPAFAAWCATVTPDDGTGRPRVAVAADARAEQALRAMIERAPIANLISGGSQSWEIAVTRGVVLEDPLSATHEIAVVPLLVRERRLGVLCFGFLHHTDEGERGVATEIARRAALAVDNAVLYRQARDAISARDDFLSIASHELRTPLTSLQLATQGIASGVIRDHDDVVRTSQVIDRQARNLAGLVSALLDVARIHAGRIELDLAELDLAQLVQECVDRFDLQVRRAGVTIATSLEPVSGRWDRARLDQVVTNLLANALKFGRHKPIEISVRAVDGDWGELVVTDHGIGIARERLPFIFDRFERAVSARQYGGLGLGLYIARSIVTAHGGNIDVDSIAGQRTSFTVSLPRGVASSRSART